MRFGQRRNKRELVIAANPHGKSCQVMHVAHHRMPGHRWASTACAVLAESMVGKRGTVQYMFGQIVIPTEYDAETLAESGI